MIYIYFFLHRHMDYWIKLTCSHFWRLDVLLMTLDPSKKWFYLVIDPRIFVILGNVRAGKNGWCVFGWNDKCWLQMEIAKHSSDYTGVCWDKPFSRIRIVEWQNRPYYHVNSTDIFQAPQERATLVSCFENFDFWILHGNWCQPIWSSFRNLPIRYFWNTWVGIQNWRKFSIILNSNHLF